MKRRNMMWVPAVLLCLLLTGCSGKNIEAQAYAVSMGIDLEEDGRIGVCVQVPTLNQSGGAEQADGKGGGKGYTFTKASGDTLTGALELLNASIPRELNLTGVKSVVVSEKMAGSSYFPEALEELALAYRVYGAAELIVCSGAADQFIRNQKAVIGLRLSESTTVALEHYRETGHVPSAKAADVFYLSHSIYGDPVAVLASDGEEAEEEKAAGYAGSLDVTGDGTGQYYGAALFREGVMVGRLTGVQTQLLNMLLGDLTEFSWVVDGVPLRIVVNGRPEVSVNLQGKRPEIRVSVWVGMMDSERGLQSGRLEEVMVGRLNEMTRLCQELAVDPFRYAECAVSQFFTVEQWLRFDWRSAFSGAQIRYEVRAEQTEL